MRTTLATRLSLAGALLATMGSPDGAVAQYRLPALVTSVEADSMHSAAARLAQAGRWGDAARLYRRSAELRAPDDPLGFTCLREAAQLSYGAGDLSGARNDMVRAANQALARGDLRAAALAYVDAAWVAQEQKKPRQVWDLGRRAEMLAASPLLPSTDRSAILNRITHVPGSSAIAIRSER
jgi:hypothetical protein